MHYDVATLRGRRADARVHRLSMGDLFERLRWSEPERIGCHPVNLSAKESFYEKTG